MDPIDLDTHKSDAELNRGVSYILESPKDQGELQLIVARPAINERQVLDQAELHVEQGLVGDNWRARGNKKTPDKKADPQMQLNIMNSRVANLVAGSKDRWPLAGDQLYVDIDLSMANLPAGSRLSLGETIIEVTAEPHLGCAKFAARFGRAATLFVNSPLGKLANFRGINAKVIRGGKIGVGDMLRKLD